MSVYDSHAELKMFNNFRLIENGRGNVSHQIFLNFLATLIPQQLLLLCMSLTARLNIEKRRKTKFNGGKSLQFSLLIFSEWINFNKFISMPRWDSCVSAAVDDIFIRIFTLLSASAVGIWHAVGILESYSFWWRLKCDSCAMKTRIKFSTLDRVEESSGIMKISPRANGNFDDFHQTTIIIEFRMNLTRVSKNENKKKSLASRLVIQFHERFEPSKVIDDMKWSAYTRTHCTNVCEINRPNDMLWRATENHFYPSKTVIFHSRLNRARKHYAEYLSFSSSEDESF